MDKSQKYLQPYRKVWEEIFFVPVSNKITCLLCGFQPSVVKKYDLHRHYNLKHCNEYSKYVDQERRDILEGLKLVYQEGSSSSQHNITSQIDNASSQQKAMTASYAISNLIAKYSKSFSDGKFIKKCLITAVESFGNSMTLKEAASIPLSDKTIKSRVEEIASSLKEKVKSLLASCSYFSLCLDEKTNNQHVSQLSIFARIVQNDFSYVEELLDFVGLYGVDIFKAVSQTLQKFNIDFSKCSAIITDSTKVMMGSNNGFISKVKKQGLKFPIIHRCIIHEKNDFGTLRKDLILFESPLTVQIKEQSLQLQDELRNLQCNPSLKTRVEKGVEFFKLLGAEHYPRLNDFGLQIFSMFGSTYLCKCSFSKMKSMKTDKRVNLKDASVSSLMRASSSKTCVDIPSLVESCKRFRTS